MHTTDATLVTAARRHEKSALEQRDLTKVGLRWTPEDDAFLTEAYNVHGRTAKEIASGLKRTPASIRTRLRTLGYLRLQQMMDELGMFKDSLQTDD